MEHFARDYSPALYTAVFSLCAGVAFGFFVGPVVWIPVALFIISALAVLFRKKFKIAFLIAVICSASALGMVRTGAVLVSESQENAASFIGQTAVVEGKIVADPDQRVHSLHVVIGITSIQGMPASGEVLAELPPQEDLSYGDTVSVRGNLRAPQKFLTNGGREFDYPDYLRVQGISVIAVKAQLVSKSSGGRSLQRSLFSLKHAFEKSLSELFSEPSNALLQGILLGERRGIPKDLQQAFVSSGLVHVVVLSGYNISIISDAILRLLSFLPPMFRFPFGALGMIAFALVSGAGATTLRAVLMGLISLLARYLGRPTEALRSLTSAAFVLVLWNPLSLIYDTSFILSFLATFGLITLSPFVESQLLRLRIFAHKKAANIRSIAASTISVQVFVLPALLYFTGVLSLVSLPANMLALPVVPMAMLFGFIAGVLNFIHPALALLPAAISSALLTWMLFVARVSTTIPFGSLTISAFPAWVALVAYVPLSFFALQIFATTKSKISR